ncbi:protein disulfide isomerase [Anaeramoeba flamelloides]|uniref:Protein disulfide isomerase n=1 Tax=Anaeramoeba flamelloides TaxID=1746091 RepID=A0AAV7YUK0_9EUKA|nr:protein disulfide isomerase [Anaeramoeba flamelloides]
MFRLILISILCLAVFCAETQTPEKPKAVTLENYDTIIQNYKIAMIHFDVDHDPYCRSVRPILKKVEKFLRSEKNVFIGSVNVLKEKTLAMRENITNYPSVRIYRKGKFYKNYNKGAEASQILVFIKKLLLPFVSKINSTWEASKFSQSLSWVVVAYVKPEQREETHKLLKEVAHLPEFDEYLFGITTDEEIAKDMKIKKTPKIVLYSNQDREKYYSDITSVQKISNFLKENSHPYIQELSFAGLSALIRTREPFVILFADSEYDTKISLVKSYMKNSKKRMEVVWLDGPKNPVFYRDFPLSGRWPCLLISTNWNDENFHRYEDKRITRKGLNKFFEEFEKGTLPVVKKIKQEEVTEANDNTALITPKDWKKFVLDETKDTFVLIYAPWCEYCKALRPHYVDIAKHFSHVEDLALFRFNGDAYQVPGVTVAGYPTLVFYPRNQKQKYISYEGSRSFGGLKEFIEENATVDLAKKKETLQENETEQKPEL